MTIILHKTIKRYDSVILKFGSCGIRINDLYHVIVSHFLRKIRTDDEVLLRVVFFFSSAGHSQ